MVTFDDFVVFGPLIISIIAGVLAICNIYYTVIFRAVFHNKPDPITGISPEATLRRSDR